MKMSTDILVLELIEYFTVDIQCEHSHTLLSYSTPSLPDY